MTRLGAIMIVDEPPACLGCGRRLRFFAGLDTDLAPEPADVSICMECGQVQVFDEDRLCRASKAEFKAAMRSPEFREAVLSARRVVARCKHRPFETESLSLLPPNALAPDRALLPLGVSFLRQLLADCGELAGALGLCARTLIAARPGGVRAAASGSLHQMRNEPNDDYRSAAPAREFRAKAQPEDHVARRHNDRLRARRPSSSEGQQGTQQPARSKVSSVTAA